MTNNTELNDIFTEENTRVKKDADGMRIEIVNTANAASANYTVYPENTMRDILNICGDIALGKGDAEHCVFEFEGRSSSDLNLTCEEFGIVNGSKLLVNPNGKVA